MLVLVHSLYHALNCTKILVGENIKKVSASFSYYEITIEEFSTKIIPNMLQEFLKILSVFDLLIKKYC